jgi:hypothetical protein
VIPAIVVLAYERPAALRRLLSSVADARYPEGADVPLVISLDRSQNPAGAETAAVARAFEWAHGAKSVLDRDEHLGVVRHFRAAGSLALEHEGVILLEDDLTVAPPYYDYATQILDAYGSDERIGGSCLYGLWFNGFTLEPFTPIDDGNDVLFLAVPHTQGLCFSAAQWAAFDAWSRSGRVRPHPELHPAFLRFGPDEWFPSLAAYLAETGRYFCFPRVSLTAGWGDAGAHFARGTTWFQTPVQLGALSYRLPALDEASAVYDGFFELRTDRMQRLARALSGVEYTVDLNATKQAGNLRSGLVLTTRPVRRAVQSFGLEMYPPELNVIAGVPGEEISLAHREDVRWDALAAIETRRRLHAYAWRRNRPSRRRSLQFAASRSAEAIRGLAGRVASRLGRHEPEGRPGT